MTAAVVLGTATHPVRAHGTTRLHFTRRGRVVFTSLAALPLVAVALVVALNGGMAAAEGTDTDTVGFGTVGFDTVGFEYVTIQPGQSLWQLAVSLAPASDPRDIIAEIVSLNQLSSDSVQAGQRLALPVGS